jgi:predicted dehydrogenase
MTNNVIRLGVVGAGAIAQRGILPHLSQPDVGDRVILQAVCDPVQGRAEAAAQKYGVRRAFTHYEDLLADGDVDAVTLASPIGLHFEQGKQAIQAGKHVHFNKTMTTTVAEADELIELAKAKGVKLVSSPGEALRPVHHKVRALIRDGAIGTPTWAACGASFGTYHEDEQFRTGEDVLSTVNPAWYFRKPGGGPLYDMTVYSLHVLTTVLGPVQRVTAMSATRIKEREFRGVAYPTDAHDNTLILLDWGDGLFGLAYGTAAGGVAGMRLGSYFGTGGAIIGEKLNGQPISYDGYDLDHMQPGWHEQQWSLPHVVGPHRHIEEQHVYEDIMQLVDWVREDKPTLATAEHARHVIDIIESAYRAAETGQTQTLTTTF